MITVDSPQKLRAVVAGLRAQGSVAFVPTMGNLHDGHLSLVREARRHAPAVVVSIFVNPLQFGANEDLDNYPRTLAADQAALQAEGVEVLFLPGVTDMYPRPLAEQTRIEVPELGELHCGASRPGHFIGVATVVCKLLNMVQPDFAVFGKKDFQQLLVIRRMVADLAIPVEIIGVDTVREVDGLAMSSRNQYLSGPERTIAPLLRERLLELAVRLREGERDVIGLQAEITRKLDADGFCTDYIAIVDTESLQALTTETRDVVVLAAAQLGAARLIDNIEVALPDRAE